MRRSTANSAPTLSLGRVLVIAVLVNLVLTGLVALAFRWPDPRAIRLLNVTPVLDLSAAGEGEGTGRGPAPVILTTADPADPQRIDINTASAAELEALPGIGPTLAGRVVRYREEHGPFSTIEELMNVQGIGVVTLDKMRGLITVH